MFEKSSAGNRSSWRDANYHQYRQALRYRSDRCSLGADRADVTGSPTRRPTTHNQYSRCVKRNLLSTTNKGPATKARINDFYQILGFATDPEPQVFRAMKEHARKYSLALKPSLLEALKQYQTTIIATHVPHYEGAAWHEGPLAPQPINPSFPRRPWEI